MAAAAPTADAAIWRLVAGASVQIPPPNSYVYYFPQGHLEQFGARNSDNTLDRPFILCRVISVGLSYHPLSDQPLAKILLQPAPNTWRRRQQQQQPIVRKVDAIDGDDVVVVSYLKVLTPSDANNGGGFSVPRSCADLIFPPLDFSADPPVQNLRIRDTRGNAWEFRHIYRGTPRRHLLTTGWSKFVNSKRLIAGESVVFAKKKRLSASSSELFVGIRRGGKVISSWKFGERSDENGVGAAAEVEAREAMEKAAKGVSFEVVYYPRLGLPDFVVSADKVEEACRIPWCAGMRVRMEVETDDSARMASSEGTVQAAVLPETGPWQGSPWKMLRVTWDEPDIILNAEIVNPWDVEHISLASHLHSEFPLAKRFKPSPDYERMLSDGLATAELITGSISGQVNSTELNYLPGATGGTQMAGTQSGHNPTRTFTQLLTDCNEPETNLYSEVLHRHSGGFTLGSSQSSVVRFRRDDDDDEQVRSSSGEASSSFRLFGTTIRKSEEGLEK